MNKILRYRYLDYPLTYLSLILFILLMVFEIKSKSLVYLVISISFISRIFQYILLIKSLQSGHKLDISILITYFISHFVLFTSLYYLNYLIYGSEGFLYSGSPSSGNKLEIDNITQINSTQEFEKNISINLLNYTASTSFLVGHSEISVNTNFGKMINIFNMIDSVSLLGFLTSFIYSSISKKHQF